MPIQIWFHVLSCPCVQCHFFSCGSHLVSLGLWVGIGGFDMVQEVLVQCWSPKLHVNRPKILIRACIKWFNNMPLNYLLNFSVCICIVCYTFTHNKPLYYFLLKNFLRHDLKLSFKNEIKTVIKVIVVLGMFQLRFVMSIRCIACYSLLCFLYTDAVVSHVSLIF